MSQPRRPRSERRAKERAAGGDAAAKDHQRRWTRIIIAAVVLIIILGIAAAAFYPTYIGPFQRTILTVDGLSIKMDYFLRLSKINRADPFETLSALTDQLIIKIEAPKYGIEVSPEDIDRELRRIAGGSSEFISESEFNAWYHQRLNQTNFSDAEYRDIIETALLAAQFQEYWAARVSTVAEQVHLYGLFVETDKEATEARERWAAGEEFTDLAAELTLDEEARTDGGELGWFPRGVLDAQFEYEAFRLTSGNVSQPVPMFSLGADLASGQQPTILGWSLFWVKERVEARDLDEESLQVIKARALENWLISEISNHQIKYYGLKNSFDSETYNWINEQLSKE